LKLPIASLGESLVALCEGKDKHCSRGKANFDKKDGPKEWGNIYGFQGPTSLTNSSRPLKGKKRVKIPVGKTHSFAGKKGIQKEKKKKEKGRKKKKGKKTTKKNFQRGIPPVKEGGGKRAGFIFRTKGDNDKPPEKRGR